MKNDNLGDREYAATRIYTHWLLSLKTVIPDKTSHPKVLVNMYNPAEQRCNYDVIQPYQCGVV